MIGHIEIMSKRYGDGYINFASKYISSDDIHREVIELKNILKKEKDFLTILESSIDEKEKDVLIDKVFGKFFSEEIIIFLKFLISKNKIKYIFSILDYIRNGFWGNNTKNLIITSVYPLDLDIIQRIKDIFEKKMKCNINMVFDFDPNLIGGIKISIDNNIFDLSISSRLKKLQNFLKKNIEL